MDFAAASGHVRVHPHHRFLRPPWPCVRRGVASARPSCARVRSGADFGVDRHGARRDRRPWRARPRDERDRVPHPSRCDAGRRRLLRPPRAGQHRRPLPRDGSRAHRRRAAHRAREQRAGELGATAHRPVSHPPERSAHAALLVCGDEDVHGVDRLQLRGKARHQRGRRAPRLVPAHALANRRDRRCGLGAGCLSQPRRCGPLFRLRGGSAERFQSRARTESFRLSWRARATPGVASRYSRWT